MFYLEWHCQPCSLANRPVTCVIPCAYCSHCGAPSIVLLTVRTLPTSSCASAIFERFARCLGIIGLLFRVSTSGYARVVHDPCVRWLKQHGVVHVINVSGAEVYQRRDYMLVLLGFLHYRAAWLHSACVTLLANCLSECSFVLLDHCRQAFYMLCK